MSRSMAKRSSSQKKILQPEFIEMLLKTLKWNGRLYISTDWNIMLMKLKQFKSSFS